MCIRPGSGTILAACARTVNLDGHKILQLGSVPGRVFSFIGGGRGQWLGGTILVIGCPTEPAHLAPLVKFSNVHLIPNTGQ